MPNGTGSARCTSKEVREGALGPSRAAERPTRGARQICRSLLQMTTLFSTDDAPGKSWRLNRGVGGLQLFVPAKGKVRKQIRLPADPDMRIKKVSEAIDVAADLLPQVLLDALRSTGAFLHSNCVPCVELFLLLPSQVLLSHTVLTPG